MHEEARTDFASQEWRKPLHEYASQLLKVFSADLASFSDTSGIEVKAEDRIELTIGPSRERSSSDHGHDHQRTIDRTAPEIQSPLVDSDFFEKWHKDAKPLLILAPFGCGKSVLLAHFTCRLAKQLMDWCANPTDSLPWVPFPVRLRAWQGKGTLQKYIEGDAQSHVNSTGGWVWLKNLQIKNLRDASRLLPLFDGLDELPDTMKPENVTESLRAKALSDIWLMFPDHHVLSSRPRHGAEQSKYWSCGSSHELHELDDEAAEKFILKRLGIAAGDVNHEVLAQYRAAQPSMNELFRRPLFLAAWCARADDRTRELPTTIAGLMEALLERVLDKRIADYRDDNVKYEAVKQEIIDNQHRLGAVLAIHADEGFGVPLEAVTAIAAERHSLALTKKTAKRFAEHAMKIGLLLRHECGTYTQKIPIVEYLIGYYYAWLADDRTREAVSPHQRLLVTAFQKRFWWRDHDEVWLYAFDLMWRGRESQLKLASALVRWVLELSKQCIDSANWRGWLPNDHEKSDRKPYSCHAFALRVMLPVGNILSEPNAVVDPLVQLACNQFMDYLKKVLNHLHEIAHPFEELTLRAPNLVMNWLLDCLKNPKYKEVWFSVASGLGDASAHLDRAAVDQLLDCLNDRKHKEAWSEIALALGEASVHLGRLEVDRLIGCLNDPEYKEAWYSIATALAQASACLGRVAVDRLLDCLNDREYKGAWRQIATALGEASAYLGRVAFDRPLDCLNDPEYKMAWYWIAFALGKASAHLDRVAANQLLDCLKDPEYKVAWGAIATALGGASAHLDRAAVDRLLECLEDPEYKEAWYSIATAVAQAWANLGPVAVDRLLDCLKDPEYKKACDWIPIALGNASAHLGGIAVNRLLDCLNDPEYKEAWSEIATALGETSAYLDRVAFDRLLDCLKDPEYIESWRQIARVLRETSAYLGRVAVDRLLDCLNDPEYKGAWYWIAFALGKASVHLDRVAVDRMIDCLNDPEHRKARGMIAVVLGEASAHFDRVAVDRLLDCLEDPEYKEAWPSIATALGETSARLGRVAFDRLLDCLNDPEHGEARYWIAIALAKVSAHLGCAAVDQLLDCLKDPEYKKDRLKVAIELGRSAHLSCFAADRLLDCLEEPEHKNELFLLQATKLDTASRESVKNRANESAEKGRIAHAIRICDAIPGLMWFVRDVRPDANAGRRIIYGVAERHDADLQLNPKFAPPRIQALLDGELRSAGGGLIDKADTGEIEIGLRDIAIAGKDKLVADALLEGMTQELPAKVLEDDVEWPSWYQRVDQVEAGVAKELLKHFGFAFTRKGHDSERLTEILTKEAITIMNQQVRASGKGRGRRIDRVDLEKLIIAKNAAKKAIS